MDSIDASLIAPHAGSPPATARPGVAWRGMLAGLAAAGLLAAAALSGCVTPPPAEAEEESAAESAAAGAGEQMDLPGVALTPEILYDTLVGEIARQREQYGEGSEALLRAARGTRDPRLAARAAQVAMMGRDYARALSAARLWAELQPLDPAPRQTLAAVHAALGNAEQSAAEFRIMIRQAPGDSADHFRRVAEILSVHGSDEVAMQVMDRIVAANAQDPQAHLARALLAQRRGLDEAMAQSVQQALALRPGWEEVALLRLEHLVRTGRAEEAGQFARDFLAANPGANRVRLLLARLLVDEDRAGDALAEFRRVLDDEPDNTEALFAAGVLSYQEGEYEDARRFLGRHLEQEPGDDRARLFLGQVNEDLGNLEGALELYRQVDEDGYYFDAQTAVSDVLAEQGMIRQALEHLDGLSPSSESEVVQLALARERVYREAKDLQQAKSVLDEALQSLPRNADLLYARGLVAAQLNLLDVHEQDLRLLLESDPDNAHALNALGYTLADQTDRLQEAFDLIERALELRPGDPFILDSMGWVHYRLGNNTEALRYLREAWELRRDAEIAAHLGEVLWVTGDRQEARRVWNEARSESPDNEVLKKTLERFLE